MACEREDAAQIGCNKVALIMASCLLKTGGTLGGERNEIDLEISSVRDGVDQFVAIIAARVVEV